MTTSFWSRRAVVYPLLALVVLLGGYLRYVGLNWDDFSGSHPDERFLTMNLLPLVGGGLEFTNDPNNFPAQRLLTRANGNVSRASLMSDPDLTLGVLRGSKSESFARYLVQSGRVMVYNDPDSAVADVAAGRVDALLVDVGVPLNLLPITDGTVNSFEQLTSEEIQRMRCLTLHPSTGGVGGFFDARCSNLNPHNSGAGFYAYGTLPLFMAYAGVQAHRELEQIAPNLFEWPGQAVIWRFLSAFFDVGTIIFVFFTGSRLHNRWAGLVAALLYAVAPLAIQKAHFGTVNAITAFWVALALWAAVGVQDRGRYFYYAVFGVAFGFALAGRINLLPLVGVVGLAMIVYTLPALDRALPATIRTRMISRAVSGLLLAGFMTVLAFRLANPYAFQGPSFFGLLPNDRFLADIASAQFGVSGASDAPPNYQWVGRMDYLYPLKDIFLWGMGIAPALLAWFGWAWAGWQLIARRLGSTRNLFLFAWVLVYFGFMGQQWVMTMRYFLPLYSALALLGGWAIVELVRRAHHEPMAITRWLLGALSVTLLLIPTYYAVNGLAFDQTVVTAGALGALLGVGALLPMAVWRARLLGAFTVGFAALWGLMFTNIYRNDLTRVEASRWVFEQISSDFSMRIEGAPEGTPLINIAIPNMNPNSALNAADLLNGASRLFVNQPYLMEFVAPADGVILEVFAPHIGAVNDNGEPRSLYVSLSKRDERGDMVLLSEEILTSPFLRDHHVLGDAYTITLTQPVVVTRGQAYTFKVEALTDALVTGQVVVTEGDWDDRITTIMVCRLPFEVTERANLPSGLVSFNECNGMRSANAHVDSYDTAMSYPIDDAQKRDSMRFGLHNGDYFISTSNRFYDTTARNDFRFPLTNRFYRALFAGELGYEVVAVFREGYAFAGLEVSDQHLPTFRSPLWFNEFEPDEAFHVYDHPVVYVLKKRADYDPALVDAFFDSYPLTQSNQLVFDSDPGAQIIGVVYWDSLTMDAAPNGLMQAPDQYDINQAGGTWSERFSVHSLLNTNQVVGTGVWWLVIALYGLLAFPVMFVIFHRMPDRGYAFARLMGLFLVAWVTWFAAGLKVPLWSQAGVIIGLGLLGAFSAVMIWSRRAEFAAWVRAHWRYVLGVEGLALALFLIMAFVRLTNPDLWHHPKGGEKPMDFAMFNAVLRATTFPAQDVWFAGGNLNYYYWGYALFGTPVLLTQIVPSFAYNLVICTVFMTTGLGAFGAAYNVIAHWGREPHSQQRRANPVLAGVAAVLLCIVLGNLDTIRVLGNGIAVLGGYQQPQGLQDWLLRRYLDPDSPTSQEAIILRAQQNLLVDRIAYEVESSLSLISGLVSGTMRALGGAPLPIGTDRWYWGPSRVLAETPGVGGNAITEMPAFTFIYGDLHAHMMSFPVLLFVIAFIFSELIHAREDRRTFRELIVSLALGGAMVGMIEAINTWDWPGYLLFAVVGLGYACWLRFETISRAYLAFTGFAVGGMIVASLGASLPYRTWYAATYGSVELWQGGKTPLWAYFDIWGLFLFLIVSLFIWEAHHWLRAIKVKDLRGKGLHVTVVLLVVIGTLLVSLVAAMMGYQVALYVLPLVVWIAFLFFRPMQSLAMQFVLVCVGLALMMTLGVEIVVLGGDIGRQNTVFKFYLQAWMLMSVAGGCALAWLVAAAERWGGRLNALWYGFLVLLVVIAAMFPVMATRGRSFDRLDPALPLTLNGMDYMASSAHQLLYTPARIDLSEDYGIIRWLQDNVQGTPTILEGREPASEYTWTARIGINTGLPTVLGWRFHQTQQRTFPQMGSLIVQREANVKTFYNTTEIDVAVNILRFYDVRYVILSGLERATSDLQGLAKFDTMVEMGLLRVVYEAGEARIFEVNQAAIDPLRREG